MKPALFHFLKRFMCATRVGLCLVMGFGLIEQVWADGKVFAYATQSQVSTPDQRAMLAFSNGVERLVIETSFMGEGTNFAWIVPLPSAPKIERVSTNFFAFLSAAYRPQLVTSVTQWWLRVLVLGAFVGLITSSVRRHRVLECVAMLALAAFGFALLIPNFVRARAVDSSNPSPPVQVLSRETVGIYDTAVLKSADGQRVADWLNSNGYQVPAQALSVLAQYAAEGWVFAAARIHRDHQMTTPNRPHPLAFTFATESAIYPLRLTGVENERCAIELFVFGAQRAEAPGFQVEYCGPADFNENATDDIFQHRGYFGYPGHEGHFVFDDPELRQFAHPSQVTTKLVGRLSARDMERDARLTWIPMAATFPVKHSRSAAFHESLNWGVGIGAVSILCVLISFRTRTVRSRVRWVLPVSLTLAAGAIRWATLPVTEVIMVHGGGSAAMNNCFILCSALEQYELERREGRRPPPATFEELRTALEKDLMPKSALNTFTSARIENEPTAGNLTLHPLTNGVSVYWHDIHGRPHRLMDLTNHIH